MSLPLYEPRSKGSRSSGGTPAGDGTSVRIDEEDFGKRAKLMAISQLGAPVEADTDRVDAIEGLVSCTGQSIRAAPGRAFFMPAT